MREHDEHARRRMLRISELDDGPAQSARVPELLADLVQNPQSEHERYIVTHVIPDGCGSSGGTG
jgi:hypothetical protein